MPDPLSINVGAPQFAANIGNEASPIQAVGSTLGNVANRTATDVSGSDTPAAYDAATEMVRAQSPALAETQQQQTQATSKTLIWLGLGAVVAFGLWLYFDNKKKQPASRSLPRSRKRNGKRRPAPKTPIVKKEEAEDDADNSDDSTDSDE